MLLKIVFTLVKFFFPRLKVITEVPIQTPAVFVCNHLGAFAPLAMMLYFGYPVRPWVNHRAMTKGLAAQEISANLFDKKSRAPLFFRKFMGSLLQYPAVWVMRAIKAIPVYYHATNVEQTFNESLHTLKNGGNIAVFAEQVHADHFGEDVASGLRTGFITIARLYARNTGKSLAFYPVHISRRNNELKIGAPVYYEKSEPHREETKRVCGAILHGMRALSQAK